MTPEKRLGFIKSSLLLSTSKYRYSGMQNYPKASICQEIQISIDKNSPISLFT
jgi:hypothetical protein